MFHFLSPIFSERHPWVTLSLWHDLWCELTPTCCQCDDPDTTEWPLRTARCWRAESTHRRDSDTGCALCARANLHTYGSSTALPRYHQGGHLLCRQKRRKYKLNIRKCIGYWFWLENCWTCFESKAQKSKLLTILSKNQWMQEKTRWDKWQVNNPGWERWEIVFSQSQALLSSKLIILTKSNWNFELNHFIQGKLLIFFSFSSLSIPLYSTDVLTWIWSG